MKLKDILARADKGYGGMGVEYDDACKFKPGLACDTLAEFVVTEIAETYDPDLSDDAQLTEARRVMETAGRELEGVIEALMS